MLAARPVAGLKLDIKVFIGRKSDEETGMPLVGENLR